MRKYKLSELPEYLHITYFKIDKLVNKKQENNMFWKPNGLYYAKGIEWLQFLKSGFGNDDISFNDEYLFINSDDLIIYEVKIKSNILVINSIDDLLGFGDKYKATFTKNHELYTINEYTNFIDWDKLSKDYDGIQFNNYYKIKEDITFEKRMFKYTWFLGWDVNGGCIWNVADVRINKI